LSVAIAAAALMLASAPLTDDAPPVDAPAIVEPAVKMPPAPLAAPTPPPQNSENDPSEIVVTAGTPPPKEDPLQAVNVVSFKAVQAIDTAFVGPVAKAYETAVPSPVRSGVRNFLSNLHEPENFLNFVLQHKIGKAAATLGRFAINSTIGVAGLFDVAKKRPFNLPVRYNGFANTLGFYGVKPGPYFYLPLIGATTVRDFIGYSVDKLVLPVSVGKPFNTPTYTIPTGALSALDHRNRTAAEIEENRTGAVSPYAATRANYLARRQAEIDALHSKSKDAPAPKP
jgi:phospholipid-binding lipoprotein MlaA